MIRIILGNVGSGKTALAVREMYLTSNRKKTYSNIVTKIKNCVQIQPDMIIKKEIVDYKKNRKTGEKEPIYKHTMNAEYWQGIKEPINIVLDEAHSIINARRAMSKINQIVTDWLALIRRVLGQAESGYGNLIFISQLSNRIDIIAREMCHNVTYVLCHYVKICGKCYLSWGENSDFPEVREECPRCGSWKIKKHSHIIEVWQFQNMQYYDMWKNFGQKTFFKHYFIKDIEEYFKYYDTLQWDNLFSSYY